MDRVGLNFQDRPSPREQVELVQYAEQRGFESGWASETRLVRDAMTLLAAFSPSNQLHPAGEWRRQRLNLHSET